MQSSVPPKLGHKLELAAKAAERGDWAGAEAMLSSLAPSQQRSLAVLQLKLRFALSRGMHADALAVVDAALKLAPQNVQLHLERSRLCALTHDLKQAVESARRAAELAPRRPELARQLATLALKAGMPDEAQRALERAFEQNPQDWNTLAARVALCEQQDDFATALSCLEQYQRTQPNQVSGYLRHAELLIKLGRLAEAESVCERGLRHVDHADLWYGLGVVREDLGKRGLAAECYQRALMLKPDWALPLAAYLELLQADTSTEYLRRAETLFAAGSTAAADRAVLGFALGKAYEATADYRRAFATREAANAVRRQQVGPHNRASLDARVQRIIASYTPLQFQRLATAASADARPVFIVGMPRSGTTLVERILGAHSAVTPMGELPDVPHAARALSAESQARNEPDSVAALTAPRLRQLIDSYLRTVERLAPNTSLRATDKTPTNFFHLGLIRMMFPQARVIWCRRDPRDIAISIHAENFAPSQRYATSLADIAHYIGAQERLMAHWLSLDVLPIHEMRYETLIADFDAQVRALIDFVHLDWEPQCLAFSESDAAVQTPSRWQVRQPLYRSSVERWRRYEEPLAQFSAELERLRQGAPSE